MIKVLYDGWSLHQAPNSPEALHLLGILGQRHPEVHPLVALTGELQSLLPKGITPHVEPVPDTRSARLAWEQRSLPRMARRLGADLLHLTTSHPPLLGKIPSVVSPADYPTATPPEGMTDRLRQALSSGGMARLRGLLWPSPLEAVTPDRITAPLYLIPPEPLTYTSLIFDGVPPELQALNLPETYILYHGPGDRRSLRNLLEAWSWAAHSIGEYYPLLILGLDMPSRTHLHALLGELDLQDTTYILPPLEPALVPHLYQGCTAVFHPAPPSAWGMCAWLALRMEKPFVAAESALADALAGAGAYLLPGQDRRALGAALITVIVEEGVAESLSQAGKQRAAGWDLNNFSDALFAAYQAILVAG